MNLQPGSFNIVYFDAHGHMLAYVEGLRADTPEDAVRIVRGQLGHAPHADARYACVEHVAGWVLVVGGAKTAES